MSEGAPKTEVRLCDYFDGSERLRSFVRRCEQDSDAVSIDYLPGSLAEAGHHEVCDGAIVVIKGGRAVALFRQWALRNGLLTPGKPISED